MNVQRCMEFVQELTKEIHLLFSGIQEKYSQLMFSFFEGTAVFDSHLQSNRAVGTKNYMATTIHHTEENGGCMLYHNANLTQPIGTLIPIIFATFIPVLAQHCVYMLGLKFSELLCAFLSNEFFLGFLYTKNYRYKCTSCHLFWYSGTPTPWK